MTACRDDYKIKNVLTITPRPCDGTYVCPASGGHCYRLAGVGGCTHPGYIQVYLSTVSLLVDVESRAQDDF